MRRTLVQWALAHALREERMTRGLTHAQAADALGIAPRTYTSWESADKRPGDQHLDAICEFLNKSLKNVVLLLHGLPDNGDTDDRWAVIDQHLTTLAKAVNRLAAQMDKFEHGAQNAPAAHSRRR